MFDFNHMTFLKRETQTMMMMLVNNDKIIVSNDEGEKLSSLLNEHLRA